jgi:GMP synthase PP-ATPase subunit
MFEKVTDLERQKIDEKTRFMSELNGILDNTQRVKLTMFKTKFAKEMQEQIRAKRKAMMK